MATRPKVLSAVLLGNGNLNVTFDQDVANAGAFEPSTVVAITGAGDAIRGDAINDIADEVLSITTIAGDETGLVPAAGEVTSLDMTQIVGIEGGLAAFPFVARLITVRILSVTYDVSATTATIVWSGPATSRTTTACTFTLQAGTHKHTVLVTSGNGTNTWVCSTVTASNSVENGKWRNTAGLAENADGADCAVGSGSLVEVP